MRFIALDERPLLTPFNTQRRSNARWRLAIPRGNCASAFVMTVLAWMPQYWKTATNWATGACPGCRNERGRSALNLKFGAAPGWARKWNFAFPPRLRIVRTAA